MPNTLPHEPPYSSYDYAVVRVVPRVERGEFVNAGVILFCRTRRYLDMRIAFDYDRLAPLAPQGLDLVQVEESLLLLRAIAQGAGPIGALALADRFHWLTAPRSTVIQTSPVHSGRCHEPEQALDQLLERLVLG